MNPRKVLLALLVALVGVACSAGPDVNVEPTEESGPSTPAVIVAASPSPDPSPTLTAVATASPTPGAVLTASPTATPAAADLEAMLPVELDGIPLLRSSLSASDFPASGDMCLNICPGEPQDLAAALGVDIDSVDLAIAYTDVDEPPGVLIVAFRFPGARTEQLIPARTLAMADPNWPGVFENLTLGGKSVTWASYSVFPSAGTMEYLCAVGDVLFRLNDAVEFSGPEDVPPLTLHAIEALP